MRIALFAVLVAGGVALLFEHAPQLPKSPDHQSLKRDAEAAFARSQPGSTVTCVVPANQCDGGLINHRLRYLLPGRQVVARCR